MTLSSRPTLPSSRRGMLQGLAALLSAASAAPALSRGAGKANAVLPGALPPTAPAPASIASASAAPTQALRTLLQTSPIAGFQYHAGEEIWAFMRPGDSLSLVREASNRFDERAVRLEWNGQKIGYVPARDNAAVSQLLDRDACLDAVITQLRESADPWERVSFAVVLTIKA